MQYENEIPFINANFAVWKFVTSCPLPNFFNARRRCADERFRDEFGAVICMRYVWG